jgi:hypothetical protein
MSEPESIHDYHRDIESIGRTFVYPLEDRGHGVLAIMFGAILPLVFILLGWTFLSYIWYTFIISVAEVGTYHADPGLLLAAFGLFAYVSHFWTMLTMSIVHGVRQPSTLTILESGLDSGLKNGGEELMGMDDVSMDIGVPTSGRFDQPIGRWH